MIEKLFETLDQKAKALQLENGHSFIENLGLSMEDIYMNDRTLLEQSTTVERRKAFQFAYLSMLVQGICRLLYMSRIPTKISRIT